MAALIEPTDLAHLTAQLAQLAAERDEAREAMLATATKAVTLALAASEAQHARAHYEHLCAELGHLQILSAEKRTVLAERPRLEWVREHRPELCSALDAAQERYSSLHYQGSAIETHKAKTLYDACLAAVRQALAQVPAEALSAVPATI